MISNLLKVAASAVLLLYATHSNAQNGLSFDGTDFVQTTYSGISGNSARTIEAWIKTTANCNPSNGGVQNIISDWGDFSTGGRFTFCILWSNAIRIEVGGNGLSGTIPVNDGNWHHVAVVYDPGATNPAQLFVDGVLDAAGTISVPVNSGSTIDMRIGQRVDGANEFNGEIDEVRVWNSAKTLTELQANMNNEMCSIPTDLVAYYRFNEGVAGGANAGLTSLTDDSGNGNNGILSTFALTGATSNWVTGATLTSGVSSSTLVEGACDMYTWAANATMYTTSGFYSEVLTGANAQGCDSIVSLNLTIYTANDLTTNVTDCDSYMWAVNGQTYTSSTSVTEPQVTGQGCPYNHTLNVTLGTSYDTTYQVEACAEYTWPLTGLTYTIPGTYPHVMNLPGDCDSIAYLDLFIIPVLTASILDNGDGTLTGNGGTAFEWIDCAADTVISGATSSSFTPTVNGSYAVIASDWGFACPDTSDCITIDYIGLEEIPFASLEVSPNPTSGKTTLSFGTVQGAITIQIRTISGQLVEEFDALNTDEITVDILGPVGIYLVQVQGTSGERRTLRVIKN